MVWIFFVKLSAMSSAIITSTMLAKVIAMLMRISKPSSNKLMGSAMSQNRPKANQQNTSMPVPLVDKFTPASGEWICSNTAVGIATASFICFNRLPCETDVNIDPRQPDYLK